MRRSFRAPLLCALALASACPSVLAADYEEGEYIRETLLLPVRGAAVGASLIVTAPFESIKGGIRAAKEVLPEKTKDIEPVHLLAGPAFFLGGALIAPLEYAPRNAKRSWERPFSNESFGLCD